MTNLLQEICGNIAVGGRCFSDNVSQLQQPHSFLNGFGVVQAMLISDSNTNASCVNTIPNGLNALNFDFLQFRVAVDIESPVKRNTRLKVRVSDTSGVTETVDIDNPQGFFFPPGSAAVTNKTIPKSVLHTIRVSLDKFYLVDLSRVSAVVIDFNDKDHSIFVSDLAFSKTGT